MSRRFWVTHKRMAAAGPETKTEYLGKFDLQDAADAAARGRFPHYVEILSVRGEGRVEALWFAVKRFLIRTLRITAGVTAGLLSYAFILDPIPDLGGIPLGSLTLGMIFNALFRLSIGMLVMYAAWFTAFGDAPPEST